MNGSVKCIFLFFLGFVFPWGSAQYIVFAIIRCSSVSTYSLAVCGEDMEVFLAIVYQLKGVGAASSR